MRIIDRLSHNQTDARPTAGGGGGGAGSGRNLDDIKRP